MDLNAGVIIASSNVHTKPPQEPVGDKQTQVDGIRSLTRVELLHPLMSLSIIYMQHPIQTDSCIL